MKEHRSHQNHRALVTCAGDWNLFCTLEAALVAAIPQDTSEWRRSYGRVFKKVLLDATFCQFGNLDLDQWNLIDSPVFHMYWTDCADVESYKSTAKDDIEAWFRTLSEHAITDWMIVLVETYDPRRANKLLLPRTTVLDKIRSDFASKNGDRCLSVINPVKSESRSAESWRGLVARIRHLILTSYNKTLVRFEEHMREQRDRRNEPDWNFSHYFLLQEQLAFVLEMLGLYDEALIQYDELDALFTQFILNSTMSECPKWLATFQKPIDTWNGVSLTASVPLKYRDMIKNSTTTLVDFRTYLFQRQSAMLLLTSKPWEIASRCLTVVHNTSKEINILEISVPIGGFACWALLMCLEVLQTCENFASNASHQVVQQCTTHQAPLWHYAKDKLWELGKLCGLLPGTPEPSSAQIHLVVTLSAGMGEMEFVDTSTPNSPTPMDKLKEALGSKTQFQTRYLELAELAMGTYKHIGRLRCARFIGRDLASFYSELGETSKACVFLLDALRSYEDQGWKDLAAQTRMELIACYLKMSDFEKYTKLSATIACTNELEILVRNFYFDEMNKTIKNKLSDTSNLILSELNDCFKVISVELLPPDRENYIKDSKIRGNIVVESHFPREIMCQKLAISFEDYTDKVAKKSLKKPQDKTNKTEAINVSSNSGNAQASPMKKGLTNQQGIDDSLSADEFVTSFKMEELKSFNPFMSPLNMTLKLDWKEDKTLDTASVHLNTPKAKLKRSDSSKYRKQSATQRQDFTHSLHLSNFIIKPGINDLILETVCHKAGVFKLGQISIVVENKLEYLSNMLLACKMGFEVLTRGICVALNKVDPKKELLAGIEHAMELIVTTGSLNIEEKSTVRLKASNGLTMQINNVNYETFKNELEITIPPSEPFNKVQVSILVLANLSPKKDDKPIDHEVFIYHPWSENPVNVTLSFCPPFSTSWKLLTSNIRKFIHCTLSRTTSDIVLAVNKPDLTTECPVKLRNLNPNNDTEYVLDPNNTSVSFMWELQMNPLDKSIPISTVFSVMYRVVDENTITNDVKQYKCPFKMQDYQTLYLVKSKVEPTKGSEFCRASQMCYLQLLVQKVSETDNNSLMYEVLADQTMWAVCGRTAGVITMDNTDPQTVTLEVMPLIAGFLPLPTVRLSKYIAAIQQNISKDGRKPEVMSSSSHPRLEPFQSGQVYHSGKAQQVHVLPSISNIEQH